MHTSFAALRKDILALIRQIDSSQEESCRPIVDGAFDRWAGEFEDFAMDQGLYKLVSEFYLCGIGVPRSASIFFTIRNAMIEELQNRLGMPEQIRAPGDRALDGLAESISALVRENEKQTE